MNDIIKVSYGLWHLNIVQTSCFAKQLKKYPPIGSAYTNLNCSKEHYYWLGWTEYLHLQSLQIYKVPRFSCKLINLLVFCKLLMNCITIFCTRLLEELWIPCRLCTDMPALKITLSILWWHSPMPLHWLDRSNVIQVLNSMPTFCPTGIDIATDLPNQIYESAYLIVPGIKK